MEGAEKGPGGTVPILRQDLKLLSNKQTLTQRLSETAPSTKGKRKLQSMATLVRQHRPDNQQHRHPRRLQLLQSRSPKQTRFLISPNSSHKNQRSHTG
jgi:hypothetical protein